MKLYRFSPIKDEKTLKEALYYTHTQCYRLCYEAMREYLPVVGNIGIFCHYEEEYETLTQISQQITDQNDAMHGKYFKLYNPITFAKEGDIPEAEYTYLYIRQPDPYRHHVGDVDFHLNSDSYSKMKTELQNSKNIPCARVFPRGEPDMIELHHPNIDALGYIISK